MGKRAFKNRCPKEFFRQRCKENLPEGKGVRSIIENVKYVLKET